MAAPASSSVEHATMVKCFDMLISGVSVDPLVVANKLVEAGLVPPKLVSTMLLPSRDSYDKATELVLQVTKVVKSSPEKFEVFMSILNNFMWLDDLVESVYKQYEANKQTPPEVKAEMPPHIKQDTSFPENSEEEHASLQRENEELEKEKNWLAQQIEVKNEERAKLIELLAAAQTSDSVLFTRSMKLEAENKEVKLKAAEKVEKLKAEIRRKDEEINSLKNQLSLVNDYQRKNHLIESNDETPRIQSAPPCLRSAPPCLTSAPPCLTSAPSPCLKPTTGTEIASGIVKRLKGTCSHAVYLIFTALGVACIATSVGLFFARPKLKIGTKRIGNYDVVFLSAFYSSQSEVSLVPTDDVVSVNFYHGLCSEISSVTQIRNKSIKLITTKNSRYKIDQSHLINGSQVNYSFTVSDSFAVSDSNSTVSDSTTDLCIANIVVFFDHIHYLKFISSGYVSKLSILSCLTPAKPLHFTVEPPKDNHNLFLGLASHYDSTLNYTINSNTLEYSIANLSSKKCNFSTSVLECSIPLSHYPSGQEICVLASLQADTFITINYLAAQHKHRLFRIASVITDGISILLFIAIGFFSLISK